MAQESATQGIFGFLPREPAELYAFLKDLRDRDPVSEIRPNVWAVTRYEDVVFVLKRPEIFSSTALGVMGMGVMAAGGAQQPASTRSREHAAAMFRNTPTIINSDPPVHGHLRNIVNRGFTPREIQRLAPRIQELTDSLLDEVVPRGEMKLMQDLAVPLPVTVIAELLGVASERRDDFKRWSDRFISTVAAPRDPETLGEIEKAMREFADYFGEVIAKRKTKPEDDLISMIVGARTPNGSLSDEEILAFCRLLLIAGNETTTSLIARMVATLLDHPDQFEKLRNDLTLLPNAVEETLRFDGIVPTLPRLTKEDVEVSEVKIQAGQIVLPFFMSGNRDERRFPDPDLFDITRNTNGHLGFGFGVHFCLGSHLARLETRTAIRGIIERLPGLRLAGKGVRHPRLRTVTEMHLGFDAA